MIRLLYITIITLIIASCNAPKTNALTGTTDSDFSTNLVAVSGDTIFHEPIISVHEYNTIDSLVRIEAVRDSNYLHYKEILRDKIGAVTDNKLEKFITAREIPLDSASLFGQQIIADFGLDVSAIAKGDSTIQNDLISCEVIINHNTYEFPNLIYNKGAFCSWEPVYKTELYASFIDDVMYMYNNFPSTFKKRYQITISDKDRILTIYTLILTELYTVYSKTVNEVTDNFLISTEPLDGHYEWAYFRTENR